MQAKKMNTGDVRKDMFHFLFRAKDPETGGSGYTEKELREESDLLIIGGSDTTSTVFAAMFFYLARNPKVYERLTGEIREKFNSADDIRSGTRLSSCRYLRAFINEAMRMNPPIGAELDREALPGGITIDGHYVQEGTKVGVASFSFITTKISFKSRSPLNPNVGFMTRKRALQRQVLRRVSLLLRLSRSGPAHAPASSWHILR